MKKFAQLLELLALTPSRNRKIEAMTQYFAATPDPDRGYALAILTGALTFKNVKPAVLRDVVTAEVDPILFGMSYDYVGDLGETIALVSHRITCHVALCVALGLPNDSIWHLFQDVAGDKLALEIDIEIAGRDSPQD